MSIRYPGLATVVVGATNPAYWIGTVASNPAEAMSSSVPHLLTIDFGSERRERALSDLDTSGAVWTGTLYNPDSDEGNYPVMVRPTVEDDAMVAYSMSACPSIPIPVPVLAYMHTVEFIVPNLYAMSEDDGFVATMMLNTPAGLYVRFSGAWHLLVDEDVVDGLNVTEVADGALAMFDQFDRAGQLVHLTAMPRLVEEGEVITTIETVFDGSAAPVTAGAVKDVGVLSSADDLTAAIEAATANPDLRWWVERRAKALGLSAEFPWTE